MEYPRFLLAVTLFMASMYMTPGPNNATVMAVGIARGFRAALPHCMAVAVGGPVMLLLVGAGFGEVFVRYPLVNEALKYAGALYLLWLAWCISGLAGTFGRKKAAEDAFGEKQRDGEAHGRDASGRNASGRGVPGRNVSGQNTTGPGLVRPLNFAQALAFQVLNPKAWLTCVSAVTMYAGADAHVWRRISIMAVFMFVLGIVAPGLWAAGGVVIRRFLSSDGMRRCNYVFAAFLVASVALLFI